MAGGRGAPPTIYNAKFHVPCVLGAEAKALPLDSSWTEARLVSVACIEIGGQTAAAAEAAAPVVVSCSDLKPLHAVTDVNESDQGAAFIRTLAVRSDCRPRSRIARRTTSTSFSVTAQLWVELEVKVRPNAHIFDTPNRALCSGWRLLLPWLVAYNREEAPMAPTSRVPALPQDLASREVSSPRGQEEQATTFQSPREARGGMQVRALEAVYASLKPTAVEPLWETNNGGVGSSVGPGPGAFGLNAVPAAVVMKGEEASVDSMIDTRTQVVRVDHTWYQYTIPGTWY